MNGGRPDKIQTMAAASERTGRAREKRTNATARSSACAGRHVAGAAKTRNAGATGSVVISKFSRALLSDGDGRLARRCDAADLDLKRNSIADGRARRHFNVHL